MTVGARSNRAPAPSASALGPTRDALLADASERAQQIVADATIAADELVAEAMSSSDATVAAATHRAAAAATARADQELAATRAQIHADVLRARSEIRQRILTETRDAARSLRTDPRYPALLDHLEALARAQLGPTAKVDRDPSDAGGAIATAGNRSVDYTLAALADRAVSALADDVARVSS